MGRSSKQLKMVLGWAALHQEELRENWLLSQKNQEQRVYDARPLLRKNTVFEPFMEIEAFNRVYVDEDGCIAWDIDPSVDSRKVWSNKVDLCSDSCYLKSSPLV